LHSSVLRRPKATATRRPDFSTKKAKFSLAVQPLLTTRITRASLRTSAASSGSNSTIPTSGDE
jgi:hypothetical protein